MEDALPPIMEELSNAKHKAQWLSTLQTYALPFIGSKQVNEITVDDIHELLRPIWMEKNETARRLRGRIERILNYAAVKKMMSLPNPAAWQGNLSVLLPSKVQGRRIEHHPSLQLKDTQRWWHDLQSRDGMGAKALQFLTLSTCRSGEARGMRWEEVEFFKGEQIEKLGFYGLWTIPAERMKADREHVVPIIKPMKDILEPMQKDEGLIFPSRKNTELSDMTLSALMKRMHGADQLGFVDAACGRPAVPHGLRSTFRNWVAENAHSREAAELQLAHKFGSDVEHAYHRTRLLTQRAELLRAVVWVFADKTR